jgi:hypothetical protein
MGELVSEAETRTDGGPSNAVSQRKQAAISMEEK